MVKSLVGSEFKKMMSERERSTGISAHDTRLSWHLNGYLVQVPFSNELVNAAFLP